MPTAGGATEFSFAKPTSQFFDVGVGEIFYILVPHQFSRSARGCFMMQSPRYIYFPPLALGPHAIIEFLQSQVGRRSTPLAASHNVSQQQIVGNC